MNPSTWEALAAGLAVLIGALGIFLGIPQWRLVRRQLVSAEIADRNHELLQAARQILLGDQPIRPPSPDNPSVIDLLKDMRDLLHEQAELAAIVAHHLSDGHGGELPPWYRR